MGKIRKHKKQVNSSVVNLPSTTTVDSPAIKVETAPILSKLNAVEPNDRAWAASSIANICQDSATRKVLLKNNAIGMLASAIGCNGPEIQVEIVGALRNFATFGGADCCKEMFKKSVILALEQVLPSCDEGVKVNTPDSKLFKLFVLLTEQVLYLIWSVWQVFFDEYNPQAKTKKLSHSIVPLCITIFSQWQSIPLQLLQVSGQCMLMITEDNPHFEENVQETFSLADQMIQAIHATSKESVEQCQIAIVCAGCVFNFSSILLDAKNQSTDITMDDIQAKTNEMNCLFLDTISLCLQSFGPSHLHSLIAQCVQDCTLVQKLDFILSTLQHSTELLANVFADPDVLQEATEEEDEVSELQQEHDPNAGEIEQFEQADSDDDMVHDHCELDVNGNKIESTVIDKASLMIPLLVETGQLMSLISDCHESIACETFKTSLSMIYSIQSRSFVAVSNLIDKISDCWIVEHGDDLRQLWLSMFDCALKAPVKTIQYADGSSFDQMLVSEYVESCVSVVFIISRRLSSNLGPIVATEHVQVLMDTVSNNQASTSLRIQCVMCLGIIAQRQGFIEINKIIGECLINTLSLAQTNVEIISEILNVLYDIYADESFDYDKPVFVALQFLSRLESITASLKTKVKSVDKRKHKALRERADEAMINLREFINYKKRVSSL